MQRACTLSVAYGVAVLHGHVCRPARLVWTARLTLSCVPEAPRAPSGLVLRDVGSRFLATAAAAAAAALAAAASASFGVTAAPFKYSAGLLTAGVQP